MGSFGEVVEVTRRTTPIAEAFSFLGSLQSQDERFRSYTSLPPLNFIFYLLDYLACCFLLHVMVVNLNIHI